MQLESRMCPDWASLHKAPCVFIEPERCQVWLRGWNIPVPKADPPCSLHFLCVPQQELSFPPAQMHQDSFPASHRWLVGISGTRGRLWLGQGRTGLGMCCSPGRNTPWALAQPCLLKANKQSCKRRINICTGDAAKEKSPLNSWAWRHKEWNFHASEAQAVLTFPAFVAQLTQVHISIFLADITMLITL